MQVHEVKDERFVVLGAARSGVAAAKLLKRRGVDVVVADEKAVCSATATCEELDHLDIQSYWGDRVRQALEGRTVLIKSPGIPQTNAVVLAARSMGVRVISEIELAAAFVSPEARIIAITGTNGKTTTTAWTAHILKGAGYNAVLAGNIGDAWSNTVDLPENRNNNTVFVVECSSFQLEDLEHFHPQIALLTNLSPDHMDRYEDDFSKYRAAKKQILRNMTADDYLVLNGADTGSTGFEAGCSSRLLHFSRNSTIDTTDGITVAAGDIAFRQDGTSTPLLPAAQLPLPGNHNLDNAMGAAMLAKLAGADEDKIREGLLSFRGVEHRIELCGERADGVRFYNDSKATNLDAMEQALKAFGKPIILIAGGRDAHSDYAAVAELVRTNVKQLILIGEATELIHAAWGSLVATQHAASMADAVQKAADIAGPQDVVVLSPACKSFDMYNDYEERGRDFKQKVADCLTA
jgi:UDP-N-acetylmuramoylalanine--D-glutamate ligase